MKDMDELTPEQRDDIIERHRFLTGQEFEDYLKANTEPEDELTCPDSRLDCMCNLLHYDENKRNWENKIALRKIEECAKEKGVHQRNMSSGEVIDWLQQEDSDG